MDENDFKYSRAEEETGRHYRGPQPGGAGAAQAPSAAREPARDRLVNSRCRGLLERERDT